MIKKFLLFIVFGIMASPIAMACDACGCSVGGSGMGLLTAYKNNYVGIGWQWSSFTASSEYESNTKDNFHILQLSARYYIVDKFKVQLSLPFRFNIRQSLGEKTSLNGISDARLLGSYILLQDTKVGNKSRLFIELGAGIKFPTGKYDAHIHDKNLPENFNMGNGSFGFIVEPNLVFTFGKTGLVLGGSYTHHAKSRSKYRFGHQLQSQLIVFFEKNVSPAVKIVPNVGVKTEWITQDVHANGKAVHATGGTGAFASVALNLKGKAWLAGVSYAHPFLGKYSDGEVDVGGRVACQVSYIF